MLNIYGFIIKTAQLVCENSSPEMVLLMSVAYDCYFNDSTKVKRLFSLRLHNNKNTKGHCICNGLLC